MTEAEAVTRPSADEKAVGQGSPFRRLTAADCDALAMAQARDCPLLTEDLHLRDAAKVVGVEPVGSIGLVLLAGLTGLVSRAEAVAGLDGLLETSSLFVTKPLIEQAKASLL